MPETDDDIAVDDIDDVIDDDDDDDDNERIDESLEDLYEEEVVKDASVDSGLEDEDEAIIKAMEVRDDEPVETLSVKVTGRADNEFQCLSCFLIKKMPQLADGDKMFCLDCA